MRYAVVIEKADGNYSAYVPTLSGHRADGRGNGGGDPGSHPFPHRLKAHGLTFPSQHHRVRRGIGGKLSNKRGRVIERLETLSRTLSEAFRRAGDTRRRGAVLLAFEIAVAEARLAGNAVDKALETLRQGGNDAGVCLAIEGLSDCLDDEYLRLANDEGVGTTDAGALVQFRKARAAAALAFALSPAPDAPAEALYEALSATDDHAEAIKTIVSSLG